MSREAFNDVYVFTELMESDLGDIIKSDSDLSNEHA